MPRIFYAVVVNCLAASITNNFIWFTVTFWAYLETKSVLITSLMAGVYSGTTAISGFFLGSLVDKYKKKKAMMLSSICSLALYIISIIVFIQTPSAHFKDPMSPELWIFIVLSLAGAIAGNMRSIALSTVVTILVPEPQRDKANGFVGSANGVTFLAASIFSGLAVGFLGMYWILILALGMTLITIVHLSLLKITEEKTEKKESLSESIDIRGTVKTIHHIPGLFGLIFFNTFNNFLGGVFMSLMDAYGLSLVSVEFWGILWGVLSLGFIIGGLVVAKTGLGKNPLYTLFICNIIMWIICIIFPLKASIFLLAAGMLAYMCLIPVVESAEQTILQKLVPLERQGRVFGFAQSIEQAASPVTAFFIGPIAQFIFIPFMTTGKGVDWIGSWFGTGPDRGLGLVFLLTGVIGLIVTLLAIRSSAYRKLSENYRKTEN